MIFTLVLPWQRTHCAQGDSHWLVELGLLAD
ncbi:hypothetical protein OKW24_000632 [Peribacillus simplex]|nr:hypothetical protein [Peribacillus simplex]